MEKENQEIEELLVQYLAGEATAEDKDLIKGWLEKSESNRKYFDELRDLYLAATVVMDPGGDAQTGESWQKVRADYYRRKVDAWRLADHRIRKTSGYHHLLRIAAVFIVAFVSGTVFYAVWNKHELKQPTAAFNEVVAPLGSKTSVTLADGTSIWLNAGSKLRYPVNYPKPGRDVYLEGEAYFKVAKLQTQKFIVHTSFLNIKVLGTEFNVKAYPEEKTIETTLVKGAVTIEGNPAAAGKISPVFLKPNEMAKFVKDSESIEVTSRVKKQKTGSRPVLKAQDEVVVIPRIDPVIYTSWKDPRWVIKSEELRDLAIKLERRYDVKITIKNESLKHYKFSGTLTDETLEQVLNIIKITAPITYTIENKNVYFFENKSSKKNYDEMLIRK